MGKLEHIGQEVAALAAGKLAAFRTRFAKFDADAWDKHKAAAAVDWSR